MATPSGTIALSDVNTELSYGSRSVISLNDTVVRTLAGVPNGTISMNDLRGKSNRVSIPGAYTFYVNTTQTIINIGTLSGYVAGKSDITITVNSGVYVYSTSTSTPALTIQGASAGDTITLVNYGYIIGMGGSATGDYNNAGSGTAGGPALSIGNTLTISNYGYIAGGGGGGGCYGGGGAGGGNASTSQNNPVVSVGALGGGPGQTGANGASPTSCCAGGGGGRILPGTGGLQSAGGGAGGGGGVYIYRVSGMLSIWSSLYGGGGGGWGASGGSGTTGSYIYNNAGTPGTGGSGGSAGVNGVSYSVDKTYAGGAGGAAIARNGNAVTVGGSGTVYGGIA